MFWDSVAKTVQSYHKETTKPVKAAQLAPPNIPKTKVKSISNHIIIGSKGHQLNLYTKEARMWPFGHYLCIFNLPKCTFSCSCKLGPYPKLTTNASIRKLNTHKYSSVDFIIHVVYLVVVLTYFHQYNCFW